jgi:hypothetical protein
MDEKLRQAQGESNQRYYQENFTWKKITKNLLSAISSK